MTRSRTWNAAAALWTALAMTLGVATAGATDQGITGGVGQAVEKF